MAPALITAYRPMAVICGIIFIHSRSAMPKWRICGFPALQQILPVADAGPDQRVAEFETVTLDGSGSTDPKIGHGNNLSYQWVQTTGTPVVLSDDTAVQPTFDAPDAGPAGKTLTFTLTVTDEDELVATDEVDVDVAIIQANAGPDQTVNESVTVTLDASNSVGVGLEYQWMQTAGTPVMLSDDTAMQPTFTAPNVGSNGETLSFRLTITDDDGLEDTDTVKITVRNPNSSGGGGTEAEVVVLSPPRRSVHQ